MYEDCTYSWPESRMRIYQLCIVSLLFVAPFVLMSISYWHIVNVLWRDKTALDSLQDSLQLEEEQHQLEMRKVKLLATQQSSLTLSHQWSPETSSRSIISKCNSATTTTNKFNDRLPVGTGKSSSCRYHSSHNEQPMKESSARWLTKKKCSLSTSQADNNDELDADQETNKLRGPKWKRSDTRTGNSARRCCCCCPADDNQQRDKRSERYCRNLTNYATKVHKHNKQLARLVYSQQTLESASGQLKSGSLIQGCPSSVGRELRGSSLASSSFTEFNAAAAAAETAPAGIQQELSSLPANQQQHSAPSGGHWHKLTSRQAASGSSTTTTTTTQKRYSKLIESRKKAAKMLIVIVIMFGLCYLPIHFLNTLR